MRDVRRRKFFTEPSLAQQSFKKECDVNEIMKKYRKSGDPSVLSKLGTYTEGHYGDFSAVGDYRSALDAVSRAADVFDALPAKVRQRFGNDPASFLDFCNDSANFDELVAMGLAKKKVVEQSDETTAT